MTIKKIVIVLILVLAMLGLQNTSKSYAVDGGIGENVIVTQSIVTARQTGEGPWDDDNEPGNDTDAGNNVVRSFDKVIWTIENTMAIKEDTEGETYQGGVLEVEARLPQSAVNQAGSYNYVKWNLDLMPWAEDGEVSEDGTVFTGKYTLKEGEDISGAKQTLNFVLDVLGAPNGLELTPTFTIGLEGNTNDEKYVLEINNTDVSKVDSKVVVSAAPQLNVQVKRNTNMNYKNRFDLETGNISEEANANTVYGRMQGYGLVLQLRNENTDKKMKGIELPKGNITFDFTLGESMKIEGVLTDVTENSGYTPVFWDYKANNNTANKGNMGRTMYFQSNSNTRYACFAAPLNTGNARNSCYQGGTWNIEQDANNPYIYHVIVSGYDFASDFQFPTNDAGDSAISSAKYGKELGIGCFSACYLQALLQVPENDDTTEQVTITATVSNLEGKTLSNQMITVDTKESDDTNSTSIKLHTTPSYSKLTYYSNCNAALDYSTGDANVFLGHDTGRIVAHFTVGAATDEEDWVYGVDFLLKFDDEAVEVKLMDNGAEHSNNGSVMTYNVLYAGKPDKKGWNSDEEMITTSIEDLVYFDTLDEILEEGYTCVACLIESTGGCAESGRQIGIGIPFNVKETAEVGKVYQVVGDMRLYTEENAPDRTIQTHTLTVDPLDYPPVAYALEHRAYVKTAYDENGNIISGTHAGGAAAGSSLLINGANQEIKVTTLDENNNEKVNFNIGKSETTVTVKLAPSLTVNRTDTITGVTLEVKVTIPEGTNYVPGSSTDGEPSKINNANGTTTLIWNKYNCTVNEEIDPILFQVKLDEELSDGKQLQFVAVTSEKVEDGETTKIGNTIEAHRTDSTQIQIINLASYSLYKTVTTPFVEINSDGSFTIVAMNKTDDDVEDIFQMLNILPYSGDSNGSLFHGEYIVKSISLAQENANTGEEIDNDSVKLYITESELVRESITAKDEEIGVSSIWEEIEPGEEINKPITAFAIKGTLKARAKMEVNVEVSMNGNQSNDKYIDYVSAQTNVLSEVMKSASSKIEVIGRGVSGYVWFDENEDGVIGENEEFAKDVEVTLLTEEGTPAQNINGETIEKVITMQDGYYQFKDMVKGSYRVKFEYPQMHATLKEIGSNMEINSKVNPDTSMTDVLTRLNTADAPSIIESFMNMGLVYDEAIVTVHHLLINDSGEKMDEKVDEDVEIETKINSTYETEPLDTTSLAYHLVETPQNASGEVRETQIDVTYYYQNNHYPYTIRYVDSATKQSIHDDVVRDDGISGEVIHGLGEVIKIRGYVYDSESQEPLTITNIEEENVLVLYYVVGESNSHKNTGKNKTKKEEKSGDDVVDVNSGEQVSNKENVGQYQLVKENNGHHEAYMKGYEDQTFRMLDNVTREQVATIFYRLTEIPEEMKQNEVLNQKPFADVQMERWSATAITCMNQLGIMKGYPDGSFAPDAPITRAEFAEVIKRYASEDIQKNEKVFKDVIASHWATDAIQIALAEGWVQGYEDGTFKPENKITRVEVVTIINRMLERKPSSVSIISNVENPFIDLDSKHWGYYEVIEAALSHDYSLDENEEEIIIKYYPFNEDMRDKK